MIASSVSFQSLTWNNKHSQLLSHDLGSFTGSLGKLASSLWFPYAEIRDNW